MNRHGRQRKQISIPTMLVLTVVAALVFLYVRHWNVPLSQWPLLFLVMTLMASMAKLAQIAIQDTTAKGVRRQYRALDDPSADDATLARSAEAESTQSDTMVADDHDPGAEDETAAD